MQEALEIIANFFNEASWIIPSAVSVAVQITVTDRTKALLPTAWTTERRDAVIWLLSTFIGISTFVLARWAWQTINEAVFELPNFVLAAMVALVINAVVPYVYAKLPESITKAYSYQSKKSQGDDDA